MVWRPMFLICFALFAYVAADVNLGYQQVRYGTVDPSHWQYALWLTAGALLTAAPVEQCRRARMHVLSAGRRSDHAASLLPYLSIAAAYVPLLLAAAMLR